MRLSKGQIVGAIIVLALIVAFTIIRAFVV
jgi:predicted small integral membrane protein